MTDEPNSEEVVACELWTCAGTFFIQASDRETLARYQEEVLAAMARVFALAAY